MALTDPGERRPFVHGDVVRLVAFDLVLWVVLAGMARISLVIEIFCVDLDDHAAHMSRL